MDWSAQCIVKLDVTRMHVFTPATKTGKSYGAGGHGFGRARIDDPHEEVGREERAEEHDLRADEEEHAERPRIDPRALVRGRRPVVVVKRFGVGAHEHVSSS